MTNLATFRHGLVVRKKFETMLFGTISEKISIVISQAILWIFGHWYQTIGKITKNFSTAWSSGQGSWHRGQNLLIPELQGHYESYQKGSENHGCYFLFLWSLAGLVLLLIWTILQTTFRLLPLTTHGMDIFDINTHCMDIFRPGPGRGQSRTLSRLLWRLHSVRHLYILSVF